MPRTCPTTISSTAGNIMSSMKERGSWRQPTMGPGHFLQWSTCRLPSAACLLATIRSPLAIARTKVLHHGRSRAKATNPTNTTISLHREPRHPGPLTSTPLAGRSCSALLPSGRPWSAKIPSFGRRRIVHAPRGRSKGDIYAASIPSLHVYPVVGARSWVGQSASTGGPAS